MDERTTVALPGLRQATSGSGASPVLTLL